MQAASRVIGHFAKADTTGTGAAVLDLHRTGDEDFALMAASAAASEGIVLAAADDLGLVDFDEAGERTAAGCYHAAAKFGGHQPGRFVRTQGELALQLQRRDAVGMGCHQIGRPEPSRQRQLGMVHDRAGGHRGLLAAAGAFPSPGFGLQPPGFVAATSRTDKAVRPARSEEVGNTGPLIGEAALELDQRAGEIEHGGLANGLCSLYVLSQPKRPHHYE